jgi:hypothetical protein
MSDELTPHEKKFFDWLGEQKALGLKNFRPSFNREAIATHFGAKFIPDPDFPMFGGHIDFSETEYKTVNHPDVREYIYKGLWDFIHAPSVRIRNDTDEWGNVLDPNHMDFHTFDERKARVEKSRTLGIRSRYEYEMVLEGHLPPTPGKTVDSVKQEWEDYKAKYLNGAVPWPHPRKDNHDS